MTDNGTLRDHLADVINERNELLRKVEQLEAQISKQGVQLGFMERPDCTAKTNYDPECDCVGNMAKQLSVLAEECGRLMQINRQLTKQLNNATHD